MQKRCWRWRDGLCDGSVLNDLLKENMTKKKELYGRTGLYGHMLCTIYNN
jgi:hypothetical protein